ncbi:acetamidase/formamidase family protein [Kribbella catacumbae]|uniref:acetamidase/formamidase family protein n=1 Tax=Kribbella catacumbae TaxID=460086 RepID=UPI00037A11EF|nr:acetamidase/formamidase family protein [Kribbella catacumbae]
MAEAGTAVRVPRVLHEFAFGARVAPVLEVDSGATLVFETLDCFSNRVESPDQRFAHESELLELIGAFNPVAGPIAIRGAVPGDALAVTIQEIQLGPVAPYAVTLIHADAGLGAPYGDTRICPIAGETVWFPTSRGDLPLPVRAMVGSLGVAPAGDGFPSLLSHPRCGGNMDCQALRVGSTLVLPVEVDGGLLSLGDVHALMGDAEITGTALETNADVTVTVELLPGAGRRMAGPYLDEPDRIGTVGCAHGVEIGDNLRAAMGELRRRLIDDCGYFPAEAHHLLGAVAEVTVNQCVHGGWSSVHTAIPRYALPHMLEPS